MVRVKEVYGRARGAGPLGSAKNIKYNYIIYYRQIDKFHTLQPARGEYVAAMGPIASLKSFRTFHTSAGWVAKVEKTLSASRARVPLK